MDRIENERALILALIDSYRTKYQMTKSSYFTGPRIDIWLCLGHGDAADLWKLSREIMSERKSVDLLKELTLILADRGQYLPLMSNQPFADFLQKHRDDCWQLDLIGYCQNVVYEADHGQNGAGESTRGLLAFVFAKDESS